MTAHDFGDVVQPVCVSGYVVHCDGNVISWKSRKQSSPALSTCESELMASVEASQEALSLKNLLHEIGEKVEDEFDVYIDNRSTVLLCRNPNYRGRVKHVDLKYHFLRHLVTENHADCKEVQGTENVADIFTKALKIETFSKHATKLLKYA